MYMVKSLWLLLAVWAIVLQDTKCHDVDLSVQSQLTQLYIPDTNDESKLKQTCGCSWGYVKKNGMCARCGPDLPVPVYTNTYYKDKNCGWCSACPPPGNSAPCAADQRRTTKCTCEKRPTTESVTMALPSKQVLPTVASGVRSQHASLTSVSMTVAIDLVRVQPTFPSVTVSKPASPTTTSTATLLEQVSQTTALVTIAPQSNTVPGTMATQSNTVPVTIAMQTNQVSATTSQPVSLTEMSTTMDTLLHRTSATAVSSTPSKRLLPTPSSDRPSQQVPPTALSTTTMGTTSISNRASSTTTSVTMGTPAAQVLPTLSAKSVTTTTSLYSASANSSSTATFPASRPTLDNHAQRTGTVKSVKKDRLIVIAVSVSAVVVIGLGVVLLVAKRKPTAGQFPPGDIERANPRQTNGELPYPVPISDRSESVGQFESLAATHDHAPGLSPTTPVILVVPVSPTDRGTEQLPCPGTPPPMTATNLNMSEEDLAPSSERQPLLAPLLY